MRSNCDHPEVLCRDYDHAECLACGAKFTRESPNADRVEGPCGTCTDLLCAGCGACRTCDTNPEEAVRIPLTPDLLESVVRAASRLRS